MCADLCNLESDVKAVESVGVDLLHFDLMDAHFVPNMPIGLELLSQLRPKTDCPYDVHLMVEDNDFQRLEFSRLLFTRNLLSTLIELWG